MIFNNNSKKREKFKNKHTCIEKLKAEKNVFDSSKAIKMQRKPMEYEQRITTNIGSSESFIAFSWIFPIKASQRRAQDIKNIPKITKHITCL